MQSFHSISFPNEGEFQSYFRYIQLCWQCFHSISFPNEGEYANGTIYTYVGAVQVSIQLVSPMKGNSNEENSSMNPKIVSIQLVSPMKGN